jgi:hypothetical protein
VPATRQQVQEIITHCQDAPVEDMMDDQCRVVGHSHKGVAFVLSQSKANLPSHAKPLAKSLGKVSDDEQYWTILMEHDKVQGFNETLPEDANPELWFKATVNYNKDNNMKVLFQKGAYILAAFPAEMQVAANLKLPRNSAFFPLLMSGFKARSSHSLKILEGINATLKKDVRIENLINRVNGPIINTFIDELTSADNTRNSYSPEAAKAAEYLKTKFESFGVSTTVEPFDPLFGPNVVGRITGTKYPNTWFVIGAHYDSRGRSSSSITETAPGANDNGSSLAMIMELMRVIQATGQKFEYSILVAAFCGEEQGTVGSRALAVKMADDNQEIVAMMAADMIAYRDVNNRAPQIGLPNRYHDPALTNLIYQIIPQYLPDVEVCEYTGCCTDNIGFHEQGYSTTRFFEACGALDDPQYHTPQDSLVRYGFDIDGQLVTAIKGILAASFTIAVPSN